MSTNKRPSAFFAATQQKQNEQTTSATVSQSNGKDVLPPNSETEKQENHQTVPPPEISDNQVVKTSFYPTQAQLEKLDDLAAEYNRRYRRQRRKIDRQDIIRFLIEQCSMNTLADL